jgi:phosphatidylglycerol:prolipoprotein diacylglycerol transferase
LLAVWAVASVVLLAWLVWRQGWNSDTRGYVPLLVAIGALIWLLLPRVVEPGQGLPIRGYGTMLLLAVLSGGALAVWRGYRVGIDPDSMLSLVFWGFLPGIIGARVYYVVTHWDEFQRPTLMQTLGEIINITQGGLVVYGALIGGMLGFGWFLLKYKLPLLLLLDVLTPGMLLGLAVGRLGCFLNGCCFGGVCDLPWAVRFPMGSPPYVQQAKEGKVYVYGLKIAGPDDSLPVIAEVEPGSPAGEQGLKPGQTLKAVNGVPVEKISDVRWILMTAHRRGRQITLDVGGVGHRVRIPIPDPLPRSAPVHPTQLYSTIDALVLCLFLLAFDPFKRRDGQLLALFLTLYPVNRVLMECIRTDEPGVWGTPLTGAQFVSIGIFIGAAGLWWYLLRRPRGLYGRQQQRDQDTNDRDDDQ